MNVGIIGLGQIGLMYDYKNNNIESHVKAVTKNQKLNLQCVSDKDNSKLIKFDKKYKASSYLNYKEMIKKNKPNFLIISVETKYHLNIIRNIYKIYKPQILLCEKPLGNDLIQTKEIIDLSKKNKTKLFCNYIRASDSSSLKISKILKQFIKHKRLNSVVYYSKGVKNTASHYIFFLISLFGTPLAINKLTKKIKINDYDYNISFELKFKDITILFIHKNFNKEISEISFYGEKLTIYYHKGGKKILIKKNNDLKKLPNTLKNYQYNHIDFIINHFYKKKFIELENKKYYLVMKIINKILSK